jgi:hypothetical protein
MQAFLEPEIFDGGVTLQRATPSRYGPQLQLVDND